MSATLTDTYILAPRQYGTCWSWTVSGGVLGDRRTHSSFGSAVNDRQAYSSAVIAHTFDPITAISLGLITIPELRGHYPDGFIALLEMLKPQ
jgi:hypothetical protein